MDTIPIPPSTTRVHDLEETPRRACPFCRSSEIYRCRARGIIERHVVRTFQFFPHWCADCDRRFYIRLQPSKHK
jgi:hypothetical protein